jgi:hypothetical protein
MLLRIPQSIIILEKLTNASVVKKISSLYGSLTFIASDVLEQMLASVCHIRHEYGIPFNPTLLVLNTLKGMAGRSQWP